VTRRSHTSSSPPPQADVHGQRWSSGGARREASERVVLRAAGYESSGWTLNVSRGGVRLIVESQVELGREYELWIGDEQSALRRRGRVVWVQDEADGQIAGIQYLDVEGAVPPSAPTAAGKPVRSGGSDSGEPGDR
jgi:PilZ domain